MPRTTTILAALALMAGVAMVAPRVAHAQSAEAQATAEEYYTKGDTAYNLGRYTEAADNFTKAYEAWPQPEFLYNIAQSYRLGGNCKEALHFYKRFKSLKEKDKDAPLSKKKLKEIDGFIKDLTECADKADNIGDQPPDGIDHPVGSGSGSATGSGSGSSTGSGSGSSVGIGTGSGSGSGSGMGSGSGAGTDVATGDDDGGDDTGDDDDDSGDDGGGVETSVAQPTLISARATGGIAVIGAGSLSVPVQPSFALSAGYPIAAGPVDLDVGAAVSFSPVPFKAMDGSDQSASLLGLLANLGVTYPVTPKIGVRGDLGLGLLSFGGLTPGNPFTVDAVGTNGALGMFNVRFAIAADYAITNNIIATVTPFSFAYSPAKSGLDMSSLTQMDFMLGVGYRM